MFIIRRGLMFLIYFGSTIIFIGILNIIPFILNIPIKLLILFFILSIVSYFYVYKEEKGYKFKLLERAIAWLNTKYAPFIRGLNLVWFVILLIPIAVIGLFILVINIIVCASFLFMTIPLVCLAKYINDSGLQVLSIVMINYIFWRVFIMNFYKVEEIESLKITISMTLDIIRIFILILLILKSSGYINLAFELTVLRDALVVTVIFDSLIKSYKKLVSELNGNKD